MWELLFPSSVAMGQPSFVGIGMIVVAHLMHANDDTREKVIWSENICFTIRSSSVSLAADVMRISEKHHLTNVCHCDGAICTLHNTNRTTYKIHCLLQWEKWGKKLFFFLSRGHFSSFRRKMWRLGVSQEIEWMHIFKSFDFKCVDYQVCATTMEPKSAVGTAEHWTACTQSAFTTLSV